MIKQLFYSGPSFEVLHEEYAKKGHIDDQAPIQSSGEITIHAPIERGWDQLIDLPQWSTFDPTYHKIRFETAANIDAHFSFRVNDFPIHAKIAIIDPGHKLTWTGISLWFKSIDRHVVEAIRDCGTRLHI